MTRGRCHRCRVFWRAFHIHNGRKLAHIGRASIFGEVTYHAAHVMHAPTVVTIAAGVLIVLALARIASGEL